ncbi:MAG: hypothetical protein K2U26_03265 [Cyclobacteriaceae bacterium]|nr:hypothetical protein [Cyclobacteriaceae bacterium]
MAHVSNINVRSRFTQVIVLIVMILVCILYAQLANAQRPAKKSGFNNPKHRVSVHKNSDKACFILHKKRTSMPRHPLFASNNRRSRVKPMAETDAPSRIASAN